MTTKLYINLILILSICLVFISYRYFTPSSVFSEFKIVFLNVGQGDSIVLRNLEGKYALIDGGKGQRVLSELGEVLPPLEYKFDFIIATHPDADHIEGLIEVIKRYEVGKFFINKSGKESSVYQELIRQLTINNVPTYELRSDNDFQWGCCINFDVVWPHPGSNVYNNLDANSTSIATIISYNNFNMYTGGDLNKDNEIISVQDKSFDVEVLKLGHHGSETSTSLDFLEKVTPEHAIISVGSENSYGHPSLKVLDMLEIYGITSWRTDLHGRISIYSNGHDWNISGEL